MGFDPITLALAKKSATTKKVTVDTVQNYSVLVADSELTDEDRFANWLKVDGEYLPSFWPVSAAYPPKGTEQVTDAVSGFAFDIPCVEQGDDYAVFADDSRTVLAFYRAGDFDTSGGIFTSPKAGVYTIFADGVEVSVSWAEQKQTEIPATVLPVVKLETNPTSGGAALSDDENAVLTQLGAKRMPIVVAVGADLELVFVLNLFAVSPAVGFAGRIDSGGSYWELIISSENGSEWVAFLTSGAATT